MSLISSPKLTDLLKSSVVTFKFRKANGDIRIARGTRNCTIAENDCGQFDAPSGIYAEKPNSFWDCEKLAWRSWSDKYNPEGVELVSVEND